MSPPPEDTIDLLINGKEVLTAKEYDVVRAFFTVPDTFSMTLGSGKTALDIEKAVPIGSLFALRINGVVQFVGYTDGFERIGTGATEITITGRDALAQLVRAHIENERSFNNATLDQLARAAITGAGIEGYALTLDAAAQRSAVAGTPIIDTTTTSKTFTSGPVGSTPSPTTNNELIGLRKAQALGLISGIAPIERKGITTVSTTQTKTITRITGFKAEKPIKWEAGETYFAAPKKDFDRAGIFLRAGTDPDGLDPYVFLLSAPDGRQTPTFWLLNTRHEDIPDNAVLVLPPTIRRVMTGRHTDYVVLGQAGGGKDGRKQVIGRFHDDEAAAVLPLPAKRVHKDPQAKNTRQANYLARKLRAEECRANSSFVYTIPHRHTMPLLANPARRAIVGPDVVVHVRDDEHGINQAMWVERVRFHKSATGGTFTEMTLLDPEHLLFGEDEQTQPVPGRPSKKHHKRS